ncbi:hypothetical protein NL676_017997 [Syzygium grande]|nr:hypothetical protein NL676_017997 [Syzygium grande]
MGFVAEGAEKNPSRGMDGWMDGREGKVCRSVRNVDGTDERQQIRQSSKRPTEVDGDDGTHFKMSGSNRPPCRDQLLVRIELDLEWGALGKNWKFCNGVLACLT